MDACWRLAQTRDQAKKVAEALESLVRDEPQLQHDLRDLEKDRARWQSILDELQNSPSTPTVDFHICPPAALGARRGHLLFKLHALLHTLQLEIGSWKHVADFLASVRAVTTDFGVESGLAELENINLSLLFPWFQDALLFDSPDDVDDARREGEHEDQAPAPAVAESCLKAEVTDAGETQLILTRLFPLALLIPGALHTLHHAVEALTDGLRAFADWFYPGLKAVVSVWRQQHVRDRFIAEHLRKTPAEVFERSLKELQLNLHDARWGSLIHTCKQLLAVRMVFLYWNGASGAPAHSDSGEAGGDAHSAEDAELMTATVRDNTWWQYLRMLLHVSRVVEHMEHWMEACPCHYRKPDNAAPLSGNQAFRTRYACPMAGRRAPELAAGALDEIIQEEFRAQRVELLLACSALTPDHLDKILKDFARGQAHLEEFFTLKLSFWQALPRQLCILGHYREDVARGGDGESASSVH